MSLNFVASAVLTTTNGLDHKEEQIENDDVDAVRRRQIASSGVGLFDQLQKNKDAKEEEWEAKRNGLMGVRPLDEEDVDHLNAYQESRDKKRRKREEEDDAEVEIFKRTREMKRQGEVVLEKKDDDADGKARGKEDESSAPEEKASVVIVKKKKKKRQVDKKVEKVEEENKLTSLLGDYGSDSE
mmetsp:Transcript_19216/g.38404  ORF Transcript_19216/g.38404 Transcript_19216/m.38404 type:complete len:184 (+) Transcript_19216:149-700(+)|eukprot:CAMPEP_0182454144 /NCGR_PEP_ID=MMETSP1319-20130603/909_1 /TAXON_ID=172717 /ORGANISM="Bolidomonas pacifica, Strain RCC208" /LENGTH=183 /DNA_ID=CAMNT_0024652127 /DNA_START=149 /DNA_END=700 /DNA_ORIENTATION=-